MTSQGWHRWSHAAHSSGVVIPPRGVKACPFGRRLRPTLIEVGAMEVTRSVLRADSDDSCPSMESEQRIGVTTLR